MLREYLKNQLPYFGDDMLRTAGIGEWPAPTDPGGAVARAANRLVAEAGWRCDNDANNLAGLQEIVEDYESFTKKTDITSLRWNVNLLGAKVYDAALLTRLKALGCSVQMCANRWLRSTDREGRCRPGVPRHSRSRHPAWPFRQRHAYFAAEPMAAHVLRYDWREFVRQSGQPRPAPDARGGPSPAHKPQ